MLLSSRHIQLYSISIEVFYRCLRFNIFKITHCPQLSHSSSLLNSSTCVSIISKCHHQIGFARKLGVVLYTILSLTSVSITQHLLNLYSKYLCTLYFSDITVLTNSGHFLLDCFSSFLTSPSSILTMFQDALLHGSHSDFLLSFSKIRSTH